MIAVLKRLAQTSGVFPQARSVYRALNPSHRAERLNMNRFFAQFVNPGDLCFDIGANLGQTIEALRACGAQVLAVEPNTKCRPTLDFHFKRDSKVKVIDAAVGREEGSAVLHFDGTKSTASLLATRSTGGGTVLTPVTTLAKLMDEYGSPKLLKVDVEGFEEEVFAGLNSPISVVCFEVLRDESTTGRAVLERLQRLGQVTGVRAMSGDYGHWLNEWQSAAQFFDRLHDRPVITNVVVRTAV